MTTLPTALGDAPQRRVRLARSILIWGQTALLCYFGFHYLSAAPEPRRPTGVVAPSRIYDTGESSELTGPWGKLVVVPMVIQTPPAIARLQVRNYQDTVIWRFAGASVAEVESLYREAGLAPRDLELLRAATGADGDAVVTRPPSEWLVELPSSQRSKLYARLRAKRAYTFARDAYSFRGDSVENWFHRSNLAEPTLDLLRKLVYRDRNAFVIADMPLIYERIRNPDERLRIERTLARTPGLSVHLVIDEDQDVEPLIRYWGTRGREDSIGPLLESLSMKKGGSPVDVVYLLPRFARVRLNSYLPLIEYYLENKQIETRDCKWAAFNFFNDVADDRFSKPDSTRLAEVLTREVDAPTEFGDIILFLDAKDHVVHACVHVAANIVFTKNGQRRHAPFVFAYLDDVRDTYQHLDVASELYVRFKVAGVTQGYQRK